MNELRKLKSPSQVHNNADLLVWACFIIGGYDRWVDVEELYLKAFDLGPARLSWRTRLDLPDYKKCAKALQELEDPNRSDHLGLFAKQGQYTRKLTESGLTWCKQYESILSQLYGGAIIPSAPNQEAGKLIRQIENSSIYKRFVSTSSIDSELWELAELFRCMTDSRRLIWDSRIDQLSSASRSNGRDDIKKFIDAVRRFLDVRIIS